MHLKETVISVSFARQQGFQLPLLGDDDKPGNGLLGFGDHILITFHLAKFDQSCGVIKL